MQSICEQQDYLVVPAESAAQEGWDAIVDGQVVNFKAGLGTAHISEHLERFPSIPVITVAEHTEAYLDSPNVTCLQGVSGHDIEALTESTMSSVVDMSDFGLDLPIITMALSSARHFGLYIEGATDIQTALSYTAAETAGVGLGVAAGAKAGAMLGAFGGPIGAGLGAIIGGLAGAAGGKLLARGFKERGFREAVTQLDVKVAEYARSYIAALHSKALALDGASANLRRRFSLRGS
ncbi:MAG: hypothetical protein M3463_03730 [Verrucomicrobiota bacterium]|nr:hypothetical protein [Verrucomicrobiota bacterium]